VATAQERLLSRPVHYLKASESELLRHLFTYHQDRGVKCTSEGGIQLVNDSNAVKHLHGPRPPPKNSDRRRPAGPLALPDDDALGAPAKESTVRLLSNQVNSMKGDAAMTRQLATELGQQQQVSSKLFYRLQRMEGKFLDWETDRQKLEKNSSEQQAVIAKLQGRWKQRQELIDGHKRHKKKKKRQQSDLVIVPGPRPVRPRGELHSGPRITPRTQPKKQ
jgi:hypothetical protein